MNRMIVLPIRRVALVAIVLLAVLSHVAITWAASAPPAKKGDMAVSGSLGFAHAFEDEADSVDPTLNGAFEYYFTPQVACRGMLGWVGFDTDVGDVDLPYVEGNIIYQWTGDSVRPFITGGVGLYSPDPDVPGLDDDTEVGLNFGGGIDWFVHSQWSIKFEGLFHGTTGEFPDSFFTGTAGAKYWF